MIDVLTTLKNEMEKLNIPYTFDTWDSDVELPQFIGEISETPTVDEDGKSEYTFILTGYATSYSYLFGVAKQLKTKYKPSLIVDGCVIQYNNTITVDNGTDDLRQIQINMTIKKWSV